MGVLETLLVIDGKPIELDAHLERMAASVEALFDAEAPSDARELVLVRARGLGLGRLRLTVTPGEGGDLGAEVATATIEPALVFPSPKLAVDLCSHIVEGGLGAHKWADRRLLEAAQAVAPAGSVTLLIDADGTVLEASRANVFLVCLDSLLTPTADGRMLPGIARRRVIGVAGEEGIEVRENDLSLDDLRQADEVFLTGSVRGVEPVRSVDGVELSGAGEITRHIATALRECWTG